MTLADRDHMAAIAATRFGLGARPGEIDDARADPQAFLKAQIRFEGADLPDPNGEAARQRIVKVRTLRDPARLASKGNSDDADPVKAAQRLLRQTASDDFLSRAQLAATTNAGFRERWALFWANHFTVSAVKVAAATVVGPFEAEAIRPHVFGRFETLLVAAETHPAMLLYLDQVRSVGPDSPASNAMGRRGGAARRQAGLNENLAREILELHTVGVDGGYSQADVTEFARAMTGMSIGGPREGAEMAGVSMFREVAHEPGARTVMGVRYGQDGREQATAILIDLAGKPQTARFVCTKIARHFVADDPPHALVAKLEQTWLGSGGRLDLVAEALITAPEAWAAPQAKFKTPYEFVMSAWRAADASPRHTPQIAPVLTMLGQKPFSAPSPKGWTDTADEWTAPDAIVKRLTWAQAFSEAVIRDRDPSDLAANALGLQLTSASALAVARAETRSEGFALLLMSPEFQRR